MSARKINVELRFSSFVNKTESCWLWTGGKIRGYGQFWDGSRYIRAHRHAYITAKGPIPPGLFVMHSCDTRDCVNPSHLTLGTLSDNNRDMTEKGRRALGERAGRAKLTADQVREIRRSPLTQREIAARYGISQGTAGYAKSGKSWKHVSEGK